MVVPEFVAAELLGEVRLGGEGGVHLDGSMVVARWIGIEDDAIVGGGVGD